VRRWRVRGKRLLGGTLRYPYEVCKADEYFEDIADEKIAASIRHYDQATSRLARDRGNCARNLVRIVDAGCDRLDGLRRGFLSRSLTNSP
jgi:hypothetical protein